MILRLYYRKQLPRPMSCFVLAVVALFALANVGCNNADPQRAPSARKSTTSTETQPTETQSAIPVLQVTAFKYQPIINPGYVGPQACAGCHDERLEECKSSSHFRTCRFPATELLPRGFSEGVNTFRRKNASLVYEMTKTPDGKPLQTAIEQRAGQTFRTESSIDLILGAKDLSDEVYLSWHKDNSMWELPIAWVYARDNWGASGFDATAESGDHARPLTLRCFECHNTWFEHLPGTLNVYRPESLIVGVTCEKCHGPAKDHVDFHRQHPDEKKPHHILYPLSLERERLIEVCTQCHSNAVRHKGAANSFRPGMLLEDHYFTTHPHNSEDDHVANQIPNLRQSKCFQASDMTCISCHDPHHTSEPVKPTYMATCIQCHKQDECHLQPDIPTALRDACVDCHMRKYVKVNVNFDLENELYVPPTLRAEHRISVDQIGTKETLLRYARIEANKEVAELEKWLLDHWQTESEQHEAANRYVAAIAAQREILRLFPESDVAKAEVERLGTLQQQADNLLISANRLLLQNQDSSAKAAYEQLLILKPKSAVAYSRLGTIAAKANNFGKARELLQRSIELDREDQYGFSMLARLAFVEKKFDEAATLYGKANEVEPYNAKLNWLWGQSLQLTGKTDEALKRWLKSLEIAPKQPEVLRAVVEAEANLGNLKDALEHAQILNSLSGYEDVSSLMLLAQINVAANDKISAASVTRRAVEVAKRLQPDAVSAILEWCKEQQLP